MGTHLIVLSESYPMTTNTTGFRWFSTILCPCALDESRRSIGKVKEGREIMLQAVSIQGFNTFISALTYSFL